MQNENCSRFAARSVSAERATFGVAHRATVTIICFRASTPVARGNTHTMGRRYATGRCFRTGDICSDAAHASGSLLCACVTAFWMFCVLGLPWVRVSKASLIGKTSRAQVIRKKVATLKGTLVTLFNASTLIDPARSNLISALYPAGHFQLVFLCRSDCRPCRNADERGDLAKCLRARMG